jgi:hypothetical protein
MGAVDGKGRRGGGLTRRSALAGGGIVAAATLGAGLTGALPALAMPDTSAPEASFSRVVAWRGLDAWRSEVAAFDLDSSGIVAEGSQVALDPVPYRLDYRLEAPSDFITRRFVLRTQGPGWWRRLELRHDGDGHWGVTAKMGGRKIELPDPGGDMGAVEGALDCDLGLSPLTNLMPIRRSGLSHHAGAENFLMAWVSVPDLSVLASAQRYEHVSDDADGSVVRYVDRGLFPGFKADLRLDSSGVILLYPELGERVEPGDRP